MLDSGNYTFKGGKNMDLNELLKTNEKAKNYFLTLPEHIQGGMLKNVRDFSSYDDIVKYAENHKGQQL